MRIMSISLIKFNQNGVYILVEVSFHIVRPGLYNDSKSIPCELFAKYMPKSQCYADTFFFLSRGGGLSVLIYQQFVLSLCDQISTSTFDLQFAILVPPQSENASYAPAEPNNISSYELFTDCWFWGPKVKGHGALVIENGPISLRIKGQCQLWPNVCESVWTWYKPQFFPLSNRLYIKKNCWFWIKRQVFFYHGKSVSLCSICIKIKVYCITECPSFIVKSLQFLF